MIIDIHKEIKNIKKIKKEKINRILYIENILGYTNEKKKLLNFMNNINLILDKIKNVNIIEKPFPHIIIDNFLSKELYNSILHELKNIQFFKNNNKKINRSTFMIHHKGKQFLKENPFKEFYNILSNNKIQDILIEKLKPSRSKDRFKDIWIQADCYRNEFKFPIHCDSGDKFLTFVLYTPLHENLDINLGTRIYDIKKKLVNIVQYKPNRIIIFPPSKYSWHNMEGNTINERNSLQAWYLSTTNRKLAPKIRRGFNSS